MRRPNNIGPNYRQDRKTTTKGKRLPKPRISAISQNNLFEGSE